MSVFERFDDTARRVLFYARFAASQAGSPHVGTEHLLLGLLEKPEERVREIFRRCRISIADALADAKGEVHRAEKSSATDEIPLHESSKEALTFALDEAKKAYILPVGSEGLLVGGKEYMVGAEHLLLGLLRLKESMASAILHDNGLQLYEVREHIAAILTDAARSDAGRALEADALNATSHEYVGDDLYYPSRRRILTVYIDPGEAPSALITEFYVALSAAYRACGGSGLEIVKAERGSLIAEGATP